MTLIEWTLVGALLASVLLVGWAAATLGDPREPLPRRPLPFPSGGKPYTGLHAEDSRTRPLEWPRVGPARREAGTGPATTGLDHWRIKPEPPPTLDQPGPVTAEHVDMSGELVRIVWPPEDHQLPAGWNEDAR